MLVTGSREKMAKTFNTIDSAKAMETAKAVGTAEIGKNGKESKGKYLENLAQVLCIRYPITFWKKSVPMLMLLDLSSKVNAIYLTFARELGLSIRSTDDRAQKIDSNTLDTFGIVVAASSVKVKSNWVKFFEETFLVANVSPEVVLRMFFLTLSGIDVDFLGWKLRWKTYITKKTFSTTKRIELVGKNKFATIGLDSESETFIIHVASLNFNVSSNSFPLELEVHLFCKPQVSGLIAKEAPIKISNEYLDFANVFSPYLASELPKHTEINNYAIELING